MAGEACLAPTKPRALPCRVEACLAPAKPRVIPCRVEACLAPVKPHVIPCRVEACLDLCREINYFLTITGERRWALYA